MTKLLHRNCPQCGMDNSAGPALSISPAEWPVKKCRGCGFIYLEEAAVYEELESNLAWEKTSAQEERRRDAAEPLLSNLSRKTKTFRRRVLKRAKLPALIRRYVTKGKVVDLGCGDGGILAQLPPENEPIGIEISRMLAARAQAALPRATLINANAVSGLAKLAESVCAGVIMSSFLEHELEPRTLLRETLRVLQPGGVAIIKVPNFDSWNRRARKERWCGFRFPEHVNYFTPRTITRMARSAGFEIRRFRCYDRLPTSDTLWIVIQKPGS
jgi:SAM-dependent methyltransferase